MNLKDIHDFLDFILDKEIGGYASPEEKDLALDRASQATFKQILPYYAERQEFNDALSPFKTEYQFTPSTTPKGIITLPANYQRLNSVWILSYDNSTETNKLKEVHIVNDDDWAERTNSQLDPVTVNDPIARWKRKAVIELYPKKPNTGEAVYLRTPVAPKFAYTRSGRVITYNPNTSVQLEWAEGELNNVMYRALQFLGVNLSQEMMVQYTQLKLQDG